METDRKFVNGVAELHKNDCIRENSVNDTMEHLSDKSHRGSNKGDECVKPKTEFSDTKMNPVRVQIYGRQNSAINPLMNVDDHVWSELSYKSTDSNIKYVDDESVLEQFRRLKKCIYCMSVGSLFMLTLAVLVFIILIFKTAPQSNTNDDTADMPQVVSAQRQHVKTSGNFMLDQNILKETGEIRWMNDIYSIIETVSDNRCVKITLSGDYFINSRFTFRIPVEEEETLFTHNLRIITENEENDIFCRQFINIPSRRTSEFRQTSVFTKIFHHLHAGELICADVSAPKLLYVSGIDNDLTIVRLHNDVTDITNL
ncbi:hypothetical protein ACF0H5_020583 [Mactra antiquata]